MQQRPIVHIQTFCKRWSFISGCFFPVNILKISRDMLSKYCNEIADQYSIKTGGVIN